MANVLNYVLNLSGVGAFTSGLVKAGNAFTDSFAKANQSSKAASQAVKVSSDVVQASLNKMSAQADLSAASIARFQAKVASQSGTLQQSRAAYAASTAEISRLTQTLQYQENVLAKLQATHPKNIGLQTSWSNQIAQTKAALDKETQAQSTASAAVQKGVLQENYMAASLKNREARHVLLNARLAQSGRAHEGFVFNVLKLVKAFEQAVTWVDHLILAFRKIQLTIQRVGKLWDWITGKKAAPGGMGTGVEQSIGPLQKMQSLITGIVPGVGVLGQAFAQFLGQLAANAVQMLVQSLAQIPQQAIAAVSSFERMTISIGAMVANQRMQTGEFANMNDALAASKKAAADLIKWMEKLAILSPFSVEEVKTSFQMALGFGFQAAEAQKLTTAMMNWAAATGKTGFEMEMVTRVMGQIRSLGKMMGNDIFQLANAGIGLDTVNRQLAKDLGKTTEEINALRAAGKITGEQVLTSLTHYMESFGDAAKAQANTLNGLLSSLKDIGPIFMRSLFGPMNDAQDKVEGVIGAIQKRLIGLVSFLQADWVVNMARQFGLGLGNIAESALVWGENVTTSFAQGLWNGVVAVLDALTNIGNLVSYWLSPGSPPKLLPDLDTWGAETIGEYFKGFMRGDLGIFNDLASQVGEAIKQAGGTEKGDQPGIISQIIGSRDVIGRAIAQVRRIGAVTQDVIQNLVASWGGGQPILEAYTRTMLELALQSDKVSAAQEELNRVTKVYDDQLAAIDEQLAGVENAQSDFVDEQKKSQYALILNDPSATLAEKAQARYEIEKLNLKKQRRDVEAEKKVAVDAAQAKLDAELARQKQLEEQLSTQKELLGIQREQNQLTRDLAEAIKAAAEAAKGAAGGKGKEAVPAKKPGGALGIELPTADEFNPFQGILDMLQAKILAVQTAWSNAWAAIRAELAPATDAFFGVKKSFDELVASIGSKSAEAQLFVADMVAFITKQLGISLPQIFKNVQGILDELRIFWEKHHTEIMFIVDLAWRTITTVVLGALLLLSGIIKAIMQIVNGDWEGAWETIQQTAANFMELALNIVGVKLDEFVAQWTTNWELLKTIVDGVIERILEGLRNTLADFKALGISIIEGITSGVIGAAAGLVAAVLAAVQGAINKVKELLGHPKSPSPVTRRTLGQPFGEGVVQGVLDSLPLLRGAVAQLVSVPASAMQQAGASYAYNSSVNFNYSPTYGGAPNQPSRDFAMLRALYGGG